MQRTRGAWDQAEASARTGWLECMLEAVDTAGCSLTRDPPRTGTASLARGPLAPASMPAPAGCSAHGVGSSLLGLAARCGCGWCGHTGHTEAPGPLGWDRECRPGSCPLARSSLCGVSVRLGCCDKTPQAGWLTNSRKLLLTVLEAGSPTSRRRQTWCVPPGSETSHDERGKRTF